MIQTTPMEEGAVSLTLMIQITERVAIFLDLAAERGASMVLGGLDLDMEMMNMILATPMQEMDQEEAVNLILMIQTTEKAASMALVDQDQDMEMMSMIQTTPMEEREVSLVQMTPMVEER